MNSKPTELLENVALDVFQSLAFVFPAFEAEDGGPSSEAPEAPVVGQIEFAGPFEGVLALSVSDRLLPEIAGNMLGLDFDDSPSSDHQYDAFKELLNVICGNLLPLLAGEEAVFDVRPSEILSEGTLPCSIDGQPAVATTRVQLEGGSAELVLFAPRTWFQKAPQCSLPDSAKRDA